MEEKDKKETGKASECPKCHIRPAVIGSDGRICACRECRGPAISAGRKKHKAAAPPLSTRPEPGSLDIVRLARALRIVEIVVKAGVDKITADVVAEVYGELE